MICHTKMHERVKKILQENSKVTYSIWKHADLSKKIKSPKDFAKCVDRNINAIAKTLFLSSKIKNDQYVLVVCPISSRVNFVEIAKTLKEKFEVSTKGELKKILDYPSNGVSPIGGWEYRVLLDNSLWENQSIFIGSGQIGEELEMTPDQLFGLLNQVAIRGKFVL